MSIYFTFNKQPAPPLTVIFDADTGFERAIRYKQGLISDGSYGEDQIMISGTASQGNPQRSPQTGQ
jgi:hypothetical protein